MPITPTCRPLERGLRSESGISKTCPPVPFPEGLIEQKGYPRNDGHIGKVKDVPGPAIPMELEEIGNRPPRQAVQGKAAGEQASERTGRA